MNILLKNATYIDWSTLEFSEKDILIEQGEGASFKFADKDFKDNKEIISIDCKGKFVTKSFVNGHHHAYSALARGMPAPKQTPQNFHEILQYIWWNLDKKLDKELIEASAYATAIESAKAGTTFIIDHHASPNAIKGSLKIIADVFEKVGLSHLLCYEISDRDGIEKAIEGLEETEQYLKDKQGLIGLHASFTIGNETLQKAAELVDNLSNGIHVHVAEDLYDQRHCMDNYHKRVVERLNDYGFLQSSKTILAHCLHLSDYERELIQKSEVYIVQNTESNLNNQVGFFNSNGLSDRIFLGTDGMHSDMVKSSTATHFIGQKFDKLKFGEAYQRLRNVHGYLNKNKFSGDSNNNLIVLEYPSPTPVTKENFLGHFFFGLNKCNITHVISNGKLIINDKEIQTVNESEILQFTKEQAFRLWKQL